MRNMSSDYELGIRNEKAGEIVWSHGSFYAASGNSEADIFKCLENGKFYVPAEGELFRYTEPPQKDKTTNKKPSLHNRLDDAKAEAAARNAERKDAPKTKKRGDVEVD